MFSFLQPVLVLEFVRGGLGGMQQGDRCCAGKHHVRTRTTLSNCDPSHCGKRVGDDPVSGTCVTVTDADWTQCPVTLCVGCPLAKGINGAVSLWL